MLELAITMFIIGWATGATMVVAWVKCTHHEEG